MRAVRELAVGRNLPDPNRSGQEDAVVGLLTPFAADAKPFAICAPVHTDGKRVPARRSVR